MTPRPRLAAALVALVFVAGACSSSASTTATPAPTAEAPVESEATETDSVESEPSQSESEPTDPEPPTEADETVTSELHDEIAELMGNRSGGLVAIHRHQGVVETIAIGTANATQRPLVVDDRLRVGSISKPFVAVMVLQLVAEGSVDLDAPITDYVDTPVGGDATVRQLLNHRSGIANYTDSPTLFGRILSYRTATIERSEILEAAAALDSQPPGGAFQYSNTNYILAGELIEAIDGTDLQTSLERRITTPLGLTGTAFELAELPAGGVGGWSRSVTDGDPTEDYRSIASSAWAAGALVSTGPDLLVFLDALVSDELLPKQLGQEMMNTSAGYGLGLQVRTDGTSTIIGHNGLIPGFASVMEIASDSGDAVVVLANNDEIFVDNIARLLERSR